MSENGDPNSIRPDDATETVRLRDCLFFLFGCSKSIKKLARCRKAIALGAFFVLIAGICREYDQEPLIRGFGLYIAPFIVSFGICCVLRLLLLPHYRKSLKAGGLGSFWTMLTLFWLTAPCAWIYAIPVEALCDSLTALKINMLLLAIVVVWRIWLFNRVLKVLTGVTTIWAVLTIAAPIIVVVTFMTQLSIVGLMGGGNRTEEQELLLSVNNAVCIVAFWSALPLLIIYIVHAYRVKEFTSFEQRRQARYGPVLKVFCPLVFVAAVAMMVPAQFQLNRLNQFRDMLELGQHNDAIAFANQFEVKQFPAAQKIYPPLEYSGFDDAAQLFAQLDGTEKTWLRHDVEKWLTRGLEGGHYWRDALSKLLNACPVTDYHRGVLHPYREKIRRDLKYDGFTRTPAVEKWLTALDIKLEEKPGEE